MLSPSQRVVTLSISAGVLIFSAIHCAINDLNVHSAVFASMLLVIVWRTSGITRRVGSEGKRKEMLGWVRVGGGTYSLFYDFKSGSNVRDLRERGRERGLSLLRNSLRGVRVWAVVDRRLRLPNAEVDEEECGTALGVCV